MHPLYQFGLLLVLFGGFIASNSTGIFASVGIGSLFVGLLVGMSGLVIETSPGGT